MLAMAQKKPLKVWYGPKEEDKQGDDQLGSLSGLPDFKTEEATVRNQLVAWQASWLKRSTTAKGNSI